MVVSVTVGGDKIGYNGNVHCMAPTKIEQSNAITFERVSSTAVAVAERGKANACLFEEAVTL